MAVRNCTLPLSLDDRDATSIEEAKSPNLRNVRSMRDRMVRGPGTTQLTPPPIPGSTTGVAIDVGTFTRNTTTGNQTVTHSLGVAPKALILLSSGNVGGTIQSGFHYGYGFTDGTTSRSASIASQYNVAGSTTARSYAAAVLTLVNYDGSTTRAQCTWVSWSSSNFVINWGTADANADVITYIVLGAAAVTAKVSEWTLTSAAGNQSVTGVGFKPQLALHLCADVGATGASTGMSHGFGAMDASGNVFGTGVYAATGSANQTGATFYNASALVCGSTAGALSFRIGFVSMDADGFTISKQVAPSGNRLVASLLLGGFANATVGSFTEPSSAAPVDQSITGLGYQPHGGMIHGATFSDLNAFAGFGRDIAYMASAITPTAQVANNLWQDLQHDPSQTGNYTTTAEAWANHEGGGGPFDLVMRSQATRKSFDTGGFTLNWNTLSGYPTNYGGYWMVRAAATAYTTNGTPRTFIQAQGGATAPVEKIAMLTSTDVYVYNATTGLFVSGGETYTGGTTRRFSAVSSTDTVGAFMAWSNGIDNIRRYDGTTFSALVTSGTNHAARTLLAFNNRIVSIRPYYGGVDYKTQVRWSINGTAGDWAGTGSGSLEVVETSSQPLTGGLVLGGRAYLTRAHEVLELIATGSLSPVHKVESRIPGMGCIATYSIAAGEYNGFWLGPDNVYMWDGASLTAVGQDIYNTLIPLIDYQNLDLIQGSINTTDSEYWLMLGTGDVFIWDYARERWFRDSYTNVKALGVLQVGETITTALGRSQFTLFGHDSAATYRVDYSSTSFLGGPIDSYFETRDYTWAESGKGLMKGFTSNLWDYGSVREVRFQSTPGALVEVGVSTDRGSTWTTQSITVNTVGVGAAFFQIPFSTIRFRFRRYGSDAYEIHGSWAFDGETAGAQEA